MPDRIPGATRPREKKAFCMIRRFPWEVSNFKINRLNTGQNERHSHTGNDLSLGKPWPVTAQR